MKIKKYDKVILFFFVVILATRTLTWYFEERFDQDVWSSNPAKRYQMADDIIDNDLLIGKSKDAIIELLGSPYDTNLFGKDNLAYRLGRPPSFTKSKRVILIIDFESDHVIQVSESLE